MPQNSLTGSDIWTGLGNCWGEMGDADREPMISVRMTSITVGRSASRSKGAIAENFSQICL